LSKPTYYQGETENPILKTRRFRFVEFKFFEDFFENQFF